MPRKPIIINPIYFTRHKCRECLGRIKWVFIPIEAHWQIINGERIWVPYNWYLDVHCFCGEVKDQAIVEECYEMHKQMVGDEIREQQNEVLVQILGIELAQAFHDASGGSR